MVDEETTARILKGIELREKEAEKIFSAKLNSSPRMGWREAVIREELLNGEDMMPNGARHLIQAKYSAHSSLVPDDTFRMRAGAPMSADAFHISGHISHSTLWIVDGRSNRLQIMRRLAVIYMDFLRVVDVYSRPVTPVCVEQSRPNIDGALPSLAVNFLNFCEKWKVKMVLGWLPIKEIKLQQLPDLKLYAE